jgi:hypothetical protein
MYRSAVRSLIAESCAYLREMISRVRSSYVSSRAYPLRQVAHWRLKTMTGAALQRGARLSGPSRARSSARR